MQPVKAQLPHAQVRPSVWARRVVMGRFVLTLSVNRKQGQDGASEQITNRLAALRQEHGLTREELAERLQIHPSTVSAMERSEYLPSLRLALRVSAVFGLPIEAIFFSPATQDNLPEEALPDKEENDAARV